MKHISAYTLLKVGGNDNPTKEEVANLLKEVGVKVDDSACDAFFKAMDGKKFADVLAAGTTKLETACAGAGGGGGGGGGDTAAGGAAAAPEPEEESSSESAQGGGGGLFGGDSDSSSDDDDDDDDSS